MREDFLHYLWKYKKAHLFDLKTTTGDPISVISVGTHNHNAGPDFFNAQLKIGNQLWAGNIEIHVNATDWFVHNHETDAAYDNVILHIVWEGETALYRKDNTIIPTLILKKYVPEALLNNYYNLFVKNNKWINCEKEFKTVDAFSLTNWLERLYFERLERKAVQIDTVLQQSKNDWEAVLFKLLSKSFGLNINGDAFFSIANSFEFSIFRKLQSNQFQLEALLFGQSGLLKTTEQNTYFTALKKEYAFLKQKFSLSNEGILPVQFFRLRPPNFPSIRLSQLANVYYSTQNLFSKIIETHTINDFYNLFLVAASEFWDTHYTFNTTSKKRQKKLTKAFVDLLLINCIIPIKFSYAKYKGTHIDETILRLVQSIPSEHNAIIKKYNSLKAVSKTALDSQALLELKTNYCDNNKCLQCTIGNVVLTK